ncbi:DNA polymerase-1 [Micromonospora sp. M71_S20]|uniref:DNA polymerase n=1 Tax=Micromonospora sp. M71_S20 TaxID=592872 RepID=UPI000EAF54E2|nr:DNA polymerase [Micromonospora sp. M71_S20]RLK22669.1 DNA polymerase-1 [Micromonospora sp. M71_S20]
MRTLTHTVGGTVVGIHFPERRADLDGFRAFLAGGDKVLAFDTEGTGLDIFSPDHRLRLAQFGNGREAWVLRKDLFAEEAAAALRQPRAYVMHNAPFDLLTVDRHLGVRLEELGGRTFDTRVLAHLIDPRSPQEGGIGLKLKPLSAVYVDPDAPDTQDGLTAEFRRLGLTKATGWAGIPIDNELYVRYAGLDVILTWRLFRELGPLVRGIGLDHLSKFEHHLQVLLAILQRKGFRLDVPYVERLRADLTDEAESFRLVAKRYGVENVNSTAQLAAALEAMGETLTERTPSGALKVDKGVLLPLADLNLDWARIDVRTPNPLADAALRSKRAEKWATTYADAFLTLKDADDRLHASIGALQARTARMSISRPPLQQLPSSDWRVRRAFIADPGQTIIAADYQAVEMRVLAALADVAKMKDAIRDGADLHSFTAALVEGVTVEEFAARLKAGDRGASKARKLYKGVGFGKVYGGGAVTLARQTGAELGAVKRAIAAYDSVYPEIKRYSRRLMSRAEFGRKEVVTPSGRHLPLDRDRLYAATNYVVQSTARDLLAQAIVDIFAAGLGDHLLLPVHDELIAQAPTENAEEVIREIGRAMESTFFGVRIESDPDVYGASWGHGYGCAVKDGRCVVRESHPHKHGVTHA